MACAKPVIGGAHGGIPEIVEDGVAGFLVPHGNVERLAQALASLLGDPARCREMGLRALERIRKEYTFANFQARLTRILDAVLRNS
jgi:glycosyltransferase involved in cell wall biosynthesis